MTKHTFTATFVVDDEVFTDIDPSNIAAALEVKAPRGVGEFTIWPVTEIEVAGPTRPSSPECLARFPPESRPHAERAYQDGYEDGGNSADTFIRFECGQEDRMGEDMGPFGFIQTTYDWIYGTPPDDPDTQVSLATFRDGFWWTEDGQKWSDFVVFGGNR